MGFCGVVLLVSLWVTVLGVPVTWELVATQWNGSPYSTAAVSSATDPGLQNTTKLSTKMSFFQKALNVSLTAAISASSKTMETSTPSGSSSTSVTSPSLTVIQPASRFLQSVHSIKSVRMNFTLRILNEDFSLVDKPLVFRTGSPIHIEARVTTNPNVSPKIYVDECYGTRSKRLSHSRRVYVIVNNRGCLYGGKSGNTSVWHRQADSALQFVIPAFLLGEEPEEEIYVHCLLTAWGQRTLSRHVKKSCYYNTASSSWQNLEDSSQNDLCNCCDSHCPSDFSPEEQEFPGEGMLHRKTVGPLTVHKEEAPWYEAQCRTMKKLVLASIAFVGSCLLAALLVGGVLALGLALFHSYHHSKVPRLRRKRKLYPYHEELQTVVGALVPSEEMEKEKRELNAATEELQQE
ncbi:PREDICTED: zona pellucida sperm-binding protein 3-like [Gavialis gangeticus]|uniref:zona pellucida sperm-binding protein 3-like n=1 Tax=Gavialis gangeticus TaxID=94835 RepID=UPI00092EE2F6|nr:PREDICTED: zona pellucida sperm-binding protein 3-like [Gavialis gangeticus]XP_019362300.1 PREDICTED: zona pellucida sperm-binding protein 3-like [Gavialis gangeticus]